MRQILFILIMVMVPSLIMAQTSGGQVKRPVKKQRAETMQSQKNTTTNLSSSSKKIKTHVGELHIYEDENTKKFGYTDDAGNVIVPAKYSYSYGTQSYFAQTEFCFLIGHHPEIGDFYDDMALVADSCGYGYIDKNGKEVIKCQYHIALPFSEGLAAVKDKNTMKWGYINKKGEVVIPFIYRYPRSFTEGYAFVEKEENKWAYIDKKGHNITPWEDSWTGYNFFVEGRAQIKRDGKYGYIDYSGKTVIPCIFVHGYFFNGKYAIVEKGNYGIINRDGKFVISPKYSRIFGIQDPYVIVKDVYGQGVIDMSGNMVLSCNYSNISFAGNDIFIIEKEVYYSKKYGFVNAKGQKLTDYEFDEAYSFNMGLAAVKKDGKWGFINTKGEKVVSLIYDDSRDFSDDGMAFVKFGDLWTSIDTKGNVVTPYGDITQANKYRAEARKIIGKSGKN